MNCIEADNVIYNQDLNNNVKEVLSMNQNEIDGLLCQLEASKQMYNEALNALYQVRTENVMIKKQFQTFMANMQKQTPPAPEAPVAEEPTPEVKCEEDIAVGEPHPCEAVSSNT